MATFKKSNELEGMEPLIDQATYEQVQAKLKDRAKSTHTPGRVYVRKDCRPALTEEEDEAIKQAMGMMTNNTYIPPLGYKLEGDKVVVDEEEAEVIKRALKEMGKEGKVSPDTEKELRRLWRLHYAKKE